MTSTDIVNLAFDRIGEAPITDIAGTGTAATLANRHYAITVQSLLRSHRWNFAISRTVLEPTFIAPTGIAESGDGEFSVTKSGHGLTTGQRVTFRLSSNYSAINGTWRVTEVSSSVFTLDDSDFSGSGTVDGEYALAGTTDWAYSIAVPTDMLRALEDDRGEADIGVKWVLESGRILTDEVELPFKYVRDETSVAVLETDPHFIDTLVLTLALKFHTALRGEGGGDALRAELVQLTAPTARKIDANEGQPRERLFPNQSLFVAARRGGL